MPQKTTLYLFSLTFGQQFSAAVFLVGERQCIYSIDTAVTVVTATHSTPLGCKVHSLAGTRAGGHSNGIRFTLFHANAGGERFQRFLPCLCHPGRRSVLQLVPLLYSLFQKCFATDLVSSSLVSRCPLHFTIVWRTFDQLLTPCYDLL